MSTITATRPVRPLAPHATQKQVREFARWMRETGITRGRRSVAEIVRLRKERAANRPAPAPSPGGAAGRAQARRQTRLLAEIRRRGGITEVLIDRERSQALAEADRDPTAKITLMAFHGMRHYSSATSWWADICYLVGDADDNGAWAVRVPGTCTTVAAALSWLEPATVRDAAAQGRGVRRQGDVYLVEASARSTGSPAGRYGATRSHVWDPETRTLRHDPATGRRHRPVRAPKKWATVKVVEQRILHATATAGD